MATELGTVVRFKIFVLHGVIWHHRLANVLVGSLGVVRLTKDSKHTERASHRRR